MLTTYRRNGKAQMSIVTVRPHRGVIGVSITESRAKFNNLVHNPACSILVSTADVVSSTALEAASMRQSADFLTSAGIR